MRIKHKINQTVISLSLLFLAISACDKIDAPYRDKDTAASMEGIEYLSDAAVVIDGDTFIFNADNSTPQKKILAEDYTGILCGNCPYAGEKLNDTIKPAYGDRLVVISVHSGFFANPCPAGFACPPGRPAGALETDFRTSVGTEWDDLFGNSNAGNPNGLIDRMDYPSRQHVKTPAEWAANIQSRSILASPFAIRIQRDFHETDKKLRLAIQTRAIGAHSGNYKLQVVLTEDSIIDWQYWYPPAVPASDPDYLHRYVLRAGVNSAFGESITTDGFENGELSLKAYKASISEMWVKKNMRIVAFVYDADTYEVKQVEEISMIP